MPVFYEAVYMNDDHVFYTDTDKKFLKMDGRLLTLCN